MPAANRFSRLAIATGLVFIGLLVYVIEKVASPARSLLLSNLLQTAVVLWATYCCFYVARRSLGYLRRLWTLLATALGFAAAAQGLESYYQSFAHAKALTPWPSDLLFLLWVTPAVLMFLPRSTEESGSTDWQQAMDYAQVGVVALTAYLYFFYVPSRWEVEGHRMVVKIMRVQLVRDLALAAGFLIQGAAVKSRSLQSFFGRMAGVFFLSSISGIAYLFYPEASGIRANWTDVVWCAPFLLAILSAATWNREEELPVPETNSSLQLTIFSQVLPVAIPLLVLVMGRRIAAGQVTIAWIAVAAAFLLSATRMILSNQKQRGIADALRQTQKALQRSERMFATAFRMSPDAVGISSLPDSRFLEVNEGFTRLTGYSHAETLGRTGAQMNLWADSTHREKIMSKLRKEGEVREEEFQCLTKTGETRVCQFSGTIIQLEEGPCALAIVRDITKRKKAEEAVRNSEERFRNLFHDLQVGVVLLGPNAETQFANQAALAMFGLTEGDALGKNSSGFKMIAIQEDGIEIPLSLRPGPRAIVSKRPVRNEVVGWRRADSKDVFWTLVDAVPYLTENGNVVSVILSISDITERKNAEEALRTSEERFRTLIREMDVGVVLHGPGGEIEFANQAAQDIFEITLGEAKGKTSAELDLISFQEDGTEIPAPMRPAPRVIRTGQTVKNEVIGWRRPGSGKVFWTLSNVAPLRGPDGAITGVLSTFTNITERRRAEEALRQLSTRLLQLQDEERRRLGRELHDSLAQTVLAVNLNLAQAMQSSESLTGRSRLALEEARRLLQEMSQEIRTLSYLLHPPLLDELGLVSAIKEYAEGFSERSGIHLELKLPTDFGRLPQEAETALFRIVQESLSNIQRHSGSAAANICLSAGAGGVRLEVQDQGSGIGQGTMRVAETSRMRLGVGILGMRERMTQLGGKLEIDSGPSGTTVRATIPLRVEVTDGDSHSRRG
ncbi:MAG TPA: PAS domain S-box protein [Candidatus Angelobacter sp.]|nr:PAS domain S-box protein [Candidatus Angelobacter sp.]